MRALRLVESGSGARVAAIVLCAAVAISVEAAPGPAMAASPKTRAAATAAHGLRLIPGRRLRYAVSFSSQAGMDMSPALKQQGQQSPGTAPAPLALGTNLKGELQLTPVRSIGGDVLVECRIGVGAFRMDVNGREAAEAAAALRRDLAHPILFQINPAGHIHALRFDPAADVVTQGVARTLLAHLQFSTPGSAGLSAWEAREEEPNGVFRVRYRRVGTAANGIAAIRKTKVSALKPAVSEPGMGSKQSVSTRSELQVEFDQDRGLLQSLQGAETFITRLNGTPVARSRNVISLRLTRRELIAPTALAALQTEALKLSARRPPISFVEAPGITPRQEEQIQRGNLAGATWPQLAAELAAMERTAPSDSAAQALLVKLKACFYLYPQTSAVAESILRGSRADGISTAMLVEALRGAGHERAQQALLGAGFARRGDPRFQQQLLPTVARLDRPVRQVEFFLRSMITSGNRDTASTATLALGTLTRTLARTEPAHARSLAMMMAQQLSKATTIERKTDWLLALGNAAQSSALPAILSSSRQAAPDVRGAALFALSHLRGEAPDRRLAEALAADAQPKVRLTAARVAENRPLSTPLRQALVRAVGHDQAPDVRLAAVRALWQKGRTLPDVRAAVQSAAKRDANPDVRRTLTAMLSQP
jgi:hypothetical protein